MSHRPSNILGAIAIALAICLGAYVIYACWSITTLYVLGVLMAMGIFVFLSRTLSPRRQAIVAVSVLSCILAYALYEGWWLPSIFGIGLVVVIAMAIRHYATKNAQLNPDDAYNSQVAEIQQVVSVIDTTLRQRHDGSEEQLVYRLRVSKLIKWTAFAGLGATLIIIPSITRAQYDNPRQSHMSKLPKVEAVENTTPGEKATTGIYKDTAVTNTPLPKLPNVGVVENTTPGEKATTGIYMDTAVTHTPSTYDKSHQGALHSPIVPDMRALHTLPVKVASHGRRFAIAAAGGAAMQVASDDNTSGFRYLLMSIAFLAACFPVPRDQRKFKTTTNDDLAKLRSELIACDPMHTDTPSTIASAKTLMEKDHT